MKRSDKRIKEYLDQGGRTFTILSIDRYRDGGTGVIQTTSGISFYICKDSKRLHSGYPTTKENLITDLLLNEYIIHRSCVFIERMEETIIHNKNLLSSVHKAI